jgi:hypothetical protein
LVLVLVFVSLVLCIKIRMRVCLRFHPWQDNTGQGKARQDKSSGLDETKR